MIRMRAFGALAGSILVMSCMLPRAFAQGGASVGNATGAGPEGTIGRGTNRVPGGPSDWAHLQGVPSAGYYDYPGPRSPLFPFSGWDRRFPRRNAFPRTLSTRAPKQPYLTDRSYEPGDGYRYPLYFDPGTRSYFYYPQSQGSR